MTGPDQLWKDLLKTHLDVLSGCDFFTIEVLSWRGLVTYYVLFFLHRDSRCVHIAGITKHQDQEWTAQVSRSVTQEAWGVLQRCRYVLDDRDKRFCDALQRAPT